MEIKLILDHGFLNDIPESITALTPDGEFVLDHDTVIGHKLWSPAAESPYNYYLFIDMGARFLELVTAGVEKENK